MSVNQRGCLYLVGLLIFAFFACFLFPFIILPQVGTAVALPVITVPAEYYLKDWPSADFELVNTLGGALLANIIVLLIAFRARSASKNWTKEVPGRFQGFVELIGELWWNLTKQQAGTKPKVKYILYPLVASIFLFLLAANWGKLLPGVESVGVLHCAAYEPVALNGFPIQETSVLGRPYFVLRNEQVLNTGTTGTSKSYKQCEAAMGERHYIEEGYLVTELDPYFDKAVVHTTAAGDTLASILAQYQADAEARLAEDLPESAGREALHEAIADHDFANVNIGYDDPYAQYTSWRSVSFSLGSIMAANGPEAGGVVELRFADGATSEGEEGAEGEEAEAPVAESSFTYNGITYALPAGADSNTPLEPGQTIVIRGELFGEKATTRANQIFTVAPFVRGVATDLSFTLGLAIMAFIAIQAFGISELGIGYFQKFINVYAIGNIAKKPLGAIDFVVGLFEIISEFGKIISLSFRLFGALFAGSVLYAVFLFLVGTTIPVIILLLEIIVGMAQAGVFAVLTLLFCAQAMISHHHDDEHEHGEAHH